MSGTGEGLNHQPHAECASCRESCDTGSNSCCNGPGALRTVSREHTESDQRRQESIYSELEPITESQEAGEHVLQVGTKHRREKLRGPNLAHCAAHCRIGGVGGAAVRKEVLSAADVGHIDHDAHLPAGQGVLGGAPHAQPRHRGGPGRD
eukprot:862116-Prorocentrum_minimum.AAC.1